MKRIASKVAIKTILYVVDGDQMIEVYDREHSCDLYPRLVFEGRCIELLRNEYSRINSSEVYGMSFDGDNHILHFTIESKYEEY